VEQVIDETICYDIQMVMGKFIKKSILENYSSMFDTDKVTPERAELHCKSCPFNQLACGHSEPHWQNVA
jgi:hypothetical protein